MANNTNWTDWEQSNLLSKVQLPDGNIKILKDATGRANIDFLREQIENLGNPMHFIGVTSTTITDGSSTVPTDIYGGTGQPTAPSNGDVIIYNGREFVYTGSIWSEFGDISHLDTGTWTPQSDVQVSVSGNLTSGTVNMNSYTPTGSVSDGTLTGEEMTSSGTFTATGTIASGNSGDVEVVTAQGALTGGTLPSKDADSFTAASLGSGFYVAGSVAQFTEGAFTPASFQAGFVTNGTAPTLTGGTFHAGTAPTLTGGTFTEGTAPTLTGGTFHAGTAPTLTGGTFHAGTAPTLGNATTGTFTTEGVTTHMASGTEISGDVDAETLIFATAATDNAVTAQGTFNAGTMPTFDAIQFNAGTMPTFDAIQFNAGTMPTFDAITFDPGTMTTVDTSKFNGGSKAEDTFVANTPTVIDVTKFNGGTFSEGTFHEGSFPTLSAATTTHLSFSGTPNQAISVTGTPAGTVSGITFTGAAATLTGTVATALTASGTIAANTFEHKHNIVNVTPQP